MRARDSILRNAFTVGALTSLSRVLGLVREMFQSRLIGAGVEQSAFVTAFAVPNMMRKLFGEGALTGAFVPVFKGVCERESVACAARLARAVLTMVLLLLVCLTVLGFGALDLFSHVCGAFGIRDTARVDLIVGLLRILLPYMIFICGAAFGMGVLNSLGRFTASSFMPSLLNILWIGVLAVLSFLPGLSLAQRVTAVAGTILVAGIAQMAFLFVCMARAGVKPYPVFRGWRDDKVRLVWRNLGIAALGAGAIQVNYMLDQLLAQWASPWAAGVVGYAERLMDLPLGVIGVTFGTVLLPTFAGFFARGDATGAKAALAASVRNLMIVMLPAAVGLAVLASDITAVIYQGGDFDATATVRVSRALAVYAAGLGFFGFQKVLVPWFQSQNDMKTPLRVSLVTVGANAALNVLAVVTLPVEWRHVGLASSTVLCALLGCVCLLNRARRLNGDLGLAAVRGSLVKIAASALAMGGALLVLGPALPTASCALGRALLLAAKIGAGGCVYAGLALALFRAELRLALRRKLR